MVFYYSGDYRIVSTHITGNTFHNYRTVVSRAWKSIYPKVVSKTEKRISRNI